MNFSTVVSMNKIGSKLCLKCKTWGDDWVVTSPSYVPDFSVRDYILAAELHQFILLRALILSNPRSFTRYQLEILNKILLCFLIMSSALHCCSLLPVDVSSEPVKVYSACFKVIRISGPVILALTVNIGLLVQNIRKHNVTIQILNIWPVWYLHTWWHL